MNPHLHAIIMAGGAGTRFWPASRSLRPKQLLPLGGDRPLLAATVDRIAPRVPAERVYIATGAHLLEATAQTVASVPRPQLLAEPAPRNTAPCIAWATATILRRDPEALIAVFPSDHFIADEPAFLAAIDRALEGAAQGCLATIGIVPTRPETGYGYIESGALLSPGLRQVARFVEKPDRARAEGYVAAGNYLWNAGMFFYEGRVMRAAIEAHLPEIGAFLRRADEAALRGDEAALVAREFGALPAVSIDHGVMEKHDRLAVAPGDFGWNDVGSWESAWELAARDGDGNALPEGSVAVDARGNLVVDLTTTGAHKRLYSLAGVSDLVLVETDDAVLLIPRERAQDVRAIVDALKARGRSDLL
jgi:mannose-1-phosphate guanylyltransferase